MYSTAIGGITRKGSAHSLRGIPEHTVFTKYVNCSDKRWCKIAEPVVQAQGGGLRQVISELAGHASTRVVSGQEASYLHSSIKVLPATPTMNTIFLSHIKFG